MELALATIQKLRNEHRVLGDRLDAASAWLGRAASREPTAPAWLAACRAVAELSERLPAHLHEENCVRCPNYEPCRSEAEPAHGAGCVTGAPEPTPHEGKQERDELGEAVRGLAELVARAGAKPDPKAWAEMSAGLTGLKKRFAEHRVAEEAWFTKSVLDSGCRKPAPKVTSQARARR